MALAQIDEITRRDLPTRAAMLGCLLLEQLRELPDKMGSLRLRSRGMGLMAGLEIRNAEGQPVTQVSLALVKAMLHRGFIVLPEGEHAEVIGLSPPLTIPASELRRTVTALSAVLRVVGATDHSNSLSQ